MQSGPRLVLCHRILLALVLLAVNALRTPANPTSPHSPTHTPTFHFSRFFLYTHLSKFGAFPCSPPCPPHFPTALRPSASDDRGNPRLAKALMTRASRFRASVLEATGTNNASKSDSGIRDFFLCVARCWASRWRALSVSPT